MFRTGQYLSTQTIDSIVLSEQNARMEFMDRLIGNAERHGEPDVAKALSRTLDDYATV